VLMKLKLIFSVLLFLTIATLGAQNKIELNSKQVSEMLLNDGKIIVLDVRTSDEFNEGHVKGAINIDIRQSAACAKIDKLSRNNKYIVHCRSNHRSGVAVDYMLQKGFKSVCQMMDGWSGWVSNNLPVQK